MDRSYTVREIDEMRQHIKIIHGMNWMFSRGNESEMYLQEQRVENLLRTYMMNGTEPNELAAKITFPNGDDQ